MSMSANIAGELAMLVRNVPFQHLYAGTLPLWFLVLALFLPRLALFLGWLQGFRFPVLFPAPFLVDAIFWLLLPRVLVLLMIYAREGISTWFGIHLLAALLVYGTGSHRFANRG